MSNMLRTSHDPRRSPSHLARHPVLCGLVIGVLSFLALPLGLWLEPKDRHTSWEWYVLAAYLALIAAGVGLIIAKGPLRKLGVALVLGVVLGVVGGTVLTVAMLAAFGVGD